MGYQGQKGERSPCFKKNQRKEGGCQVIVVHQDEKGGKKKKRKDQKNSKKKNFGRGGKEIGSCDKGGFIEKKKSHTKT